MFIPLLMAHGHIFDMADRKKIPKIASGKMTDLMAEGFQLARTAIQLIDINIQPAVFIDH